jgi:hypothetical protein
MKLTSVLAAGALVTAAFALHPASAHEIDLQIAGYQYLGVIQELPPEVAVARYVSTPAARSTPPRRRRPTASPR